MRKTPGCIARFLRERGFEICRNTVARILKSLRISPKTNRKCIAIRSSSDRSQQFDVIQTVRGQFSEGENPILSVDSKKRELVGLFKRAGRVWTREALRVNDYDYPSYADGVAIPYGIYDVQKNKGFVFVGVSRDTSEFAVNCVASWWRYQGWRDYPKANELLILADGGGSNGWRRRGWKVGIQRDLCNQYGLTVTVAHYPTGASKWNPVEHRLFSEISKQWAGQPLRTLDFVLSSIAGTSTAGAGGLRVRSYLDHREYEKGVKHSDETMATLELEPAEALGNWNYTIWPNHAN